MQYTRFYVSPMGNLLLASDGERLTGLWFDGQKYFACGLDAEHEEKALPVFGQTAEWLDTYFTGREPDFTPPLHMKGTEFQREVWGLLLQIPYGRTATYGELARRLALRREGARLSARAVGGAVGHNPIALIVPCHRVVGSGGKLVGYAGGLERKEKLLALETGRPETPGRKCVPRQIRPSAR